MRRDVITGSKFAGSESLSRLPFWNRLPERVVLRPIGCGVSRPRTAVVPPPLWLQALKASLMRHPNIMEAQIAPSSWGFPASLRRHPKSTEARNSPFFHRKGHGIKPSAVILGIPPKRPKYPLSCVKGSGVTPSVTNVRFDPKQEMTIRSCIGSQGREPSAAMRGFPQSGEGITAVRGRLRRIHDSAKSKPPFATRWWQTGVVEFERCLRLADRDPSGR